MADGERADDALPGRLEESQAVRPRLWARMRLLGLGLLLAFVVAALLNAFGQRPATSTARSSAATLTVSAPERLRGGLYFQATFEVKAAEVLRHPKLILDPGWLDSMTLNSLEPSPSSERSANGRLELTFPRVDANDTLDVSAEWQVNPTNHGSASQSVELTDGTTPLARVNRTVTIFP